MRFLATLALLALASCEASSDSRPAEVFGADAPMPRNTVWIVTPFNDTELIVFENEAEAKAHAQERG